MAANSTPPTLDPYTTLSQNNDLTLHEKIKGVHDLIKGAQVGMLTTRSADGTMHSRAMTPASPFSETELTLTFIANNVSHKFDEIQNDDNVNVSFYNSSTTAWASYSGKAKITQDKETIHKHWSSYVSAYFGDLKDGKHTGDENDPRVSIIQVYPEEVRYWVPTKTAIARVIDAGVGAMTGRTSAPGEIRTIGKDEIKLTQGLHSK